MELIVISNPLSFAGEALLINRLFAAGMQRFHLRKETHEKSDYERLLFDIDEQYHERIALHNFHELAPDFGITRIHYSEQLRTAGPPLDFYLNKSYTLSTSIHNLHQLADLEKFKYAFYGPVFNSISKEGYLGRVASDFKCPRTSDTKLIALGGIDLSNIDRIKPMNFDGLAILGCLWKHPGQAVDTFKKIQEICREADHS